MPYGSMISRTDTASLVPEDAARAILKETAESGVIFQLAKRLPDMSRAQRRMPIANAFATAYFVTGDTGLKQTTELDWADKFIDAEEIAAIVPIPQAVLDDVDYDIWGEVRPAIVEAFNVAITQAVLYGTNIPATWTTNFGGHAGGLVGLCTAHSTTASIAAFSDLYESMLGESADGLNNSLVGLVEAQGYGVTGHLAAIGMKGRFRNSRSTDGVPLFNTPLGGGQPSDIDGAPIYFPNDGSVVPGSALDIAGDWKQLVWSMRQDITYTMATEGVITDAGGNIVYNLFQQDMVALRAVMRLGFALPNPISRMASGATRCPFAILTA